MGKRIFFSPTMPNPGIFLHGLPSAQGKQLLVLQPMKFYLHQKMPLALPEPAGWPKCTEHILQVRSSVSLRHASTCKWHTEADTDKDLFFSSHRKSKSTGASAVDSVAGLCQGLRSLWFSESFFHDCYLTLSTGCLGSRVLVHIQGWKKWEEEYYWASSCLLFPGKLFSTQRGWEMTWAFPGSIAGRSKALDEYS